MKFSTEVARCADCGETWNFVTHLNQAFENYHPFRPESSGAASSGVSETGAQRNNTCAQCGAWPGDKHEADCETAAASGLTAPRQKSSPAPAEAQDSRD